MNDIEYLNYLFNLFKDKELKREHNNNYRVNLYLSLLSLNNNKYHEMIHQDEINMVENYLRKINNLKVKIQLRRKDEEINNLLDEIKKIYDDNQNILGKYNRDNLDILNILENKVPSEITSLIDSLTKAKITRIDKLDYYNNIRKEIISCIYDKGYTIKDDTLYIGDITLSLEEFYLTFDYLLDINNYVDVYKDEEIKKEHSDIIASIIQLITDNKVIDRELIPIILTYLMIGDNTSFDELDASKFNILNIKISDLYSLANGDMNFDIDRVAKWRKVYIPNSFMYLKIKEMVSKGMYYFKDDNFILENIDNNISDFKTTIKVDDMINFINDNILNINEKGRTKHI